MTHDDQTPKVRDDRESPLVYIDPDFSMPERTDRYLRAFRILFPKAS
ncbi:MULTISPECIES: hypothetical protein [Microbacterium]|nr:MULTISPECIES: hypothetical protein [unclassified Microbacterium]